MTAQQDRIGQAGAGQPVSMGRVVWYALGFDKHDELIWRPATVVRVWDVATGHINLRVDLDGPNDLALSLEPQGGLFQRSINEHEAIASSAWRQGVVPGEGVGRWKWPPRA